MELIDFNKFDLTRMNELINEKQIHNLNLKKIKTIYTLSDVINDHLQFFTTKEEACTAYKEAEEERLMHCPFCHLDEWVDELACICDDTFFYKVEFQIFEDDENKQYYLGMCF